MTSLTTVGLKPTNIVPLIPSNTGMRFLGTVQAQTPNIVNHGMFSLIPYTAANVEIPYCSISENSTDPTAVSLNVDSVGGVDTNNFDVTIASSSTATYDLSRPASNVAANYYKFAWITESATYGPASAAYTAAGNQITYTALPAGVPTVTNGYITGTAKWLMVQANNIFYRVLSLAGTVLTLETTAAASPTANGLVLNPSLAASPAITLWSMDVTFAKNSAGVEERYTPGLNNLAFTIIQPGTDNAKISFPETPISLNQPEIVSYPEMGTKLMTIRMVSPSDSNNVCVIWDTLPAGGDPLVVKAVLAPGAPAVVVNGMVSAREFEVSWTNAATDATYTNAHIVITDTNGLSAQCNIATIRRFASNPSFLLTVNKMTVAESNHATEPINSSEKTWYLSKSLPVVNVVATVQKTTNAAPAAATLGALPGGLSITASATTGELSFNTGASATSILKVRDLFHTENGAKFYIFNNLSATIAPAAELTRLQTAFTNNTLDGELTLKPYTKASPSAEWKYTNGSALPIPASLPITSWDLWQATNRGLSPCIRLRATNGSADTKFKWSLRAPQGLQFNLGETFTSLSDPKYNIPGTISEIVTFSQAPSVGYWNVATDPTTQLVFSFLDDGSKDTISNIVPPTEIQFNGPFQGKEIGNKIPGVDYLREPELWMKSSATSHPAYDITCTGRGVIFGNQRYPTSVAPNYYETNRVGTGVQWVFVEMKADTLPANSVLLRMSDICNGGVLGSLTNPLDTGLRMDLRTGSRDISNLTSDPSAIPFSDTNNASFVVSSAGKTSLGLDNAGAVCLQTNAVVTIDQLNFHRFSRIYTLDVYDASDSNVPNAEARLRGEVGFVFWRKANANLLNATTASDLRLAAYSAPDIAFTAPRMFFNDTPLNFSYTGFALPILQQSNAFGLRPTVSISLTGTDTPSNAKAVSTPFTSGTDRSTNNLAVTMSATITAFDPDLRYNLRVESTQDVAFKFPLASDTMNLGTVNIAFNPPQTFLLQPAGNVLQTPTTITLVTGYNALYGNENDKIVVNENLDSVITDSNSPFISYYGSSVSKSNTFFDLDIGSSLPNGRWNPLSAAGTRIALIKVPSFAAAAPLATIASYAAVTSVNPTGLLMSLDSQVINPAIAPTVLELSGSANAANALKIINKDEVVPVNPYYLLVRVTPEGVCRYRRLQWVTNHEISAMTLSANLEAYYPDSFAMKLAVTPSSYGDNPHQALWWVLERRDESTQAQAWEVAKSARGFYNLSYVSSANSGDKPRVIEAFLTGLPEKRATASSVYLEYRLSAYGFVQGGVPNPLPVVRSNILKVSANRPASFPTNNDSYGNRVARSAAPNGNYMTQKSETLSGITYWSSWNNPNQNTREVRFDAPGALYDTVLPSDDTIRISAVNTAAPPAAGPAPVDYTIELPSAGLFPLGKSITLEVAQPTDVQGFAKNVMLVPRSISNEILRTGNNIVPSFTFNTSARLTVANGINNAGQATPYWEVDLI